MSQSSLSGVATPTTAATVSTSRWWPESGADLGHIELLDIDMRPPALFFLVVVNIKVNYPSVAPAGLGRSPDHIFKSS